MTGDTLGGLVAAVRDHLAPLLVGQDACDRPALMRGAAARAGRQHRRALGGRDGAARSRRPRAGNTRLIDVVGEAAAHAGQADVAPRQQARPSRTSPRRAPRGARASILQAQDRREAARRRDRSRACGARGARAEDAALRRRQWRADARQRASATSSARAPAKLAVHRAAAAARRPQGPQGARARAEACRSGSTRASTRSPTSRRQCPRRRRAASRSS